MRRGREGGREKEEERDGECGWILSSVLHPEGSMRWSVVPACEMDEGRRLPMTPIDIARNRTSHSSQRRDPMSTAAHCRSTP
eukprot:498646-Rhodomonas_salina.3